jgi:hypothetical protein
LEHKVPAIIQQPLREDHRVDMLREDWMFIDPARTAAALVGEIESMMETLGNVITVGYTHDIDLDRRVPKPIDIGEMIQGVHGSNLDIKLLFHESRLDHGMPSFDGDLVVAYTVLGSHLAREFSPASKHIVMRDVKWKDPGKNLIEGEKRRLVPNHGTTLRSFQDYRFNGKINKEYREKYNITFESLKIDRNYIYQPTKYAEKDFRSYMFIREAAMYVQRETEAADTVDIFADYFPDDLFHNHDLDKIRQRMEAAAVTVEAGEKHPVSETDQLRVTLADSLEVLGNRLEKYEGAKASPANTFMYALAAGAVLLFWEAIVGT